MVLGNMTMCSCGFVGSLQIIRRVASIRSYHSQHKYGGRGPHRGPLRRPDFLLEKDELRSNARRGRFELDAHLGEFQPTVPEFKYGMDSGEAVFYNAARKLKGGLTLSQEKMFSEYCNAMLLHNQKVNITALKTRNDVFRRHFLNTLILFPFLDKYCGDRDDFKIVDVGSGPGVPGIPVAILRPHMGVVLNDCVKKKCTFQAIAIEGLGIKNAESIWSRGEELGRAQDFRENFDVAVTRAVSKLHCVAELTLPLLKVGGHSLAMKTIGDSNEEILKAEKVIELTGGKIVEVVLDAHTGPDETGKRFCVVVIEKIRKTPIQFPRPMGDYEKKPIL